MLRFRRQDVLGDLLGALAGVMRAMRLLFLGEVSRVSAEASRTTGPSVASAAAASSSGEDLTAITASVAFNTERNKMIVGVKNFVSVVRPAGDVVLGIGDILEGSVKVQARLWS